MLPTFIRASLIILSWSTVFFLPKNSLKRFLPVSFFTSLLVVLMSMLSIPYKWWTVQGSMKRKITNDLSFIFGPFFVGTIWIFHFTYGKFCLYLITNAMMDYTFAYPLTALFQRLKVYKLVNFKPIHVFLSFLSYAVIIYGYQSFLQKSQSNRFITER
ncbi:hypothetical protein HNR31_003457 [Anoxybacillus caldiproteolyticus]|uniref:Uncharacterized protein n=1 Tax=Thermaerobacillus caldiproteolyticus TaxID=247480 RepID=A0A7W0C145_9BACL|nr:hypothetical protein [Anoxybacillus caldiproteolyticus]